MKLLLPWIGLLASFAPAQDAALEENARRLVDSAYFVTDDTDARIYDWLAMVERDPRHPLTEAALRLLRRTSPENPAAIAPRVLALRSDRMTPEAAAVLAQLQAEFRASALSRNELARREGLDLFPDRLERGLVLGPF